MTSGDTKIASGSVEMASGAHLESDLVDLVDGNDHLVALLLKALEYRRGRRRLLGRARDVVDLLLPILHTLLVPAATRRRRR
eukprot:6192828-Pleurochrysis_carterae.AAC.1